MCYTGRVDETPRTYCCIDLKSFYASVECVDRKWDPFEKNLVVADPERTEKTICLAVSPAMKALGVPGRCRVFEIPEGIEYFMGEAAHAPLHGGFGKDRFDLLALRERC